MASKTTQFKRTVSGTLNSGLSSVFGSEGRRYFIIEHKDDSSLHSRGEQQKLIVDEVFIGRDPKCQVRIDEKFGTVSREHAMIVKDGDNWRLVHRSQTNQTYVNGQLVQGDILLQNGDEIQLASNGPRLGFIVPQGDQSLVKSIGLTARLSLFRQQALRPYKTALAIISTVALLAIAGLVAWNIISDKKADKRYAELVEQLKVRPSDTVIIEKLRSVYGTRATNAGAPFRNTSAEENAANNPEAIKVAGELLPFENSVFFVRMTEITVNYGDMFEIPSQTFQLAPVEPSATGFLNSDGYFITARHVIEPWAHIESELKSGGLDYDNPIHRAAFAIAVGGSVEATIVAESKNGDRRTYHFTDFTVSDKRYKEVKTTSTDNNDNNIVIRQVFSHNDYAYLKTNTKSNLVMNRELSKNLAAGSRLDILGFPYGMGGDKNNIRPLYTFATVAHSGLYHGQIAVTGDNSEQGNSGSPVFYKQGDKYYVVGLVSSSLGNHAGIIVPASAISY